MLTYDDFWKVRARLVGPLSCSLEEHNLLLACSEELSVESKVIDIGCGDGRLAIAFISSKADCKRVHSKILSYAAMQQKMS